ncbi:MAG: hypothetical protein IJ393_02080 [Clostridia bacterium]|nr:hypothetical protein [Clostridia bacterium]
MKTLKKFALLLFFGTALAGFVSCGTPNNVISNVSSTSQSISKIESTSDSILDSNSEFESSFISFSSSECSNPLESSSEETSSTVLDSSREENSSELDSSFDGSSSEKDSSLSSPENSSSSAPKSYNLDGAINYLKTEYENFYNYTRSDYYLVNKVVYLENEYTIIWSVNVDCITVNEQETNYWIDVDESTLEDVPYVLTAKVVAPDDTYKEFSFERTLQGIRSASSAVELDLKELRTNIDDYVGSRVGFEGTVTNYYELGVYIENYDAETQLFYGIYVYMGFASTQDILTILSVGNRVRIVGTLSYSEIFGYQISNLKYDPFNPYNPNYIIKLGEGYEGAYREVTEDEFFSQVEIDGESFNFSDLAMNTTISMSNLKVIDTYTTNIGGENDGAITLFCQWNDNSITLRINAIKNANGELVFTQDMFLNKTIDVKGILDQYAGDYQIRIYVADHIVIH